MNDNENDDDLNFYDEEEEEEIQDDEEEVEGQEKKGKNKMNKTQKKREEREKTREKYNAAIAAYKNGEFPSVNSCAVSFGVTQKTLANYIKTGATFVGKGKTSIVFSKDEESQIINFVKTRVELGVGLDFRQLCLVIQELLTRLKTVKPTRYSPPTWVKFYPDESFVRRFIARNGISLRRTMSLSSARAYLSVSDLDSWQTKIKERFVDSPKLSEVWKDPRRIHNQDETALEFGSEHQTVLAPKGHKGPLYNIGGSSRDHVTLSVTVSASGAVTGMRVVYSGKRMSKEEKELRDNLPQDGVTGRWRFSKSEKGYVNREIFLDILKDLSDYLDENNIERPVVLFIDGFSGHLGLAIAEFCEEFGIQLILFHSNMTHILQPLGMHD